MHLLLLRLCIYLSHVVLPSHATTLVACLAAAYTNVLCSPEVEWIVPSMADILPHSLQRNKATLTGSSSAVVEVASFATALYSPGALRYSERLSSS